MQVPGPVASQARVPHGPRLGRVLPVGCWSLRTLRNGRAQHSLVLLSSSGVGAGRGPSAAPGLADLPAACTGSPWVLTATEVSSLPALEARSRTRGVRGGRLSSSLPASGSGQQPSVSLVWGCPSGPRLRLGSAFSPTCVVTVWASSYAATRHTGSGSPPVTSAELHLQRPSFQMRSLHKHRRLGLEHPFWGDTRQP